MIREYGIDQITHDPRSVVTVGTFDGVHRGHQAVIAYLNARAQSLGGRSVVVSFDPHPRSVVRGEAVPIMTTIDERAALLEVHGVDRFIVIAFDDAFARLRATEFVLDVLVGRIGLKEIVIGYDHGFGRDREGNEALLTALGTVHGFGVDVIPPQAVADHVVSSSEVRRLLIEEGDMEGVSQRLGRTYRFTGVVEHGEARGRLIGYPTANLRVTPERRAVPRNGVYAVQVHRTGLDAPYTGMMNIGVRPTFDGDARKVEVHLFDMQADLYGETLAVGCVARIRDEQKFASVDALVAQLQHDEQAARTVLAGARTTPG